MDMWMAYLFHGTVTKGLALASLLVKRLMYGIAENA